MDRWSAAANGRVHRGAPTIFSRRSVRILAGAPSVIYMDTITCDRIELYLAAAIDRALTAAARERLLCHLAGCDRCRMLATITALQLLVGDEGSD